ncbi:MAG: hypothetical protein QG670_2593, partial [Thermoproteota archaeon]|nr:hypothetical protein [Thermoproteota archaeon]
MTTAQVLSLQGKPETEVELPN